MNLYNFSRCHVPAVFAAALLGLTAFGQSVTTTPVGAVILSLPKGTTSTSLMLEESPVFIGTVSSATSNSLSVNSANWTNGAYALASTPYAVRIRTGAISGSTFQITANTANSLTLNTKGLDISSLIKSSDAISIFPVDTLGTLFGTTSVDFKTGKSASSADNIMLWSGSAWLTYYHNGTSWRRSGSVASQNDAVIMPDDGINFVRRGSITLTLVVTGNVRDSGSRILIPGTSSSFVGNSFPVNQQLSTLPFLSMSGWKTATSASSADRVMVWGGVSWLTFYNNGTSWKRSGSLSNQDTYVIPAGSPYFVKRVSKPARSSSYAFFTLPYTF